MERSQRDRLAAAAQLICRAYLFGAIILSSSIGMRAAQSSPNGSPTAPPTKAKKIWTNDDLQGSSVSRGATDRSASSSDAAAFLAPHDGDVVWPGEVLRIEVSVTPGMVEGPVGIVSEIGASNEVRKAVPYSFTMDVSRDNSVGAGTRLIGKHSIYAFGKVKGQQGFDLASIDVDVEETEMPTKLAVGGNMLSQYGPPGARFTGAGEQQFIAINATFPNRDEFDVINSTHVTVISGNLSVVAIGEEGMLTSVGPGSTSVTATYTLGGQSLQVSLPVSVTAARR